MRKAILAAALAAAVLACGCATQRPGGVEEYYAGNYEAARSIYETNLAAEPNSKALYHLRLGTLSLDEGRLEEARDHFIDATAIMEDFRAEGEFRALVGQEATKEYKGDPYEQMTALWYLGLLDYMLGDYTKALPSFKSAALADGGTTEDRYRSDAASVFVMLGKTYDAIGNRMKADQEYEDAAGVYTLRQTVMYVADALAKAKAEVDADAKEPEAAEAAYGFLTDGISAGATMEQDPARALGATREFAFETLEKARNSKSEKARLLGQDANIIAGYITAISRAADGRLGTAISTGESPLRQAVRNVSDADNNLLVVVGLGRGPYKYATGEYGEMARIAKASYSERYAEVYIDGQYAGRAQTMEDIYYQASTRGSRQMDGILAGKAVFKGVTEVGAAIALSQAVGADSEKGRRNALIVGAGLLALSLMTQAEADTRSWETLPDRIDMLGVKASSGSHTVEVRFAGGGTQRFEGVETSEDGETVIYARSGGGGGWSCPQTGAN